ncbi:MAG TPA: protein kinase [Candidatus Acidoferrales bacterium]|nr:protein kinase [Candidatus Acidoferrales bacterium]
MAPLGTGGMGEVYRARDTKLGRDVALKVLPEAFAADAERMARFEREAKVLASLNHPNIAAIYGFEDANGTDIPARVPLRALVMELVEGPTLAERVSGVVGAGLKPAPTIAKGIPLAEALPIARQICEGLEYAHERGIVHRDLKPANVKVTPDGAVKLLDFGLAKALEGESAAGEISTSPTISRLATQAGIILGTAAYMSPEQAKGKPVDRRADIWAFGCVLYEMLTGKPAFGGETVTDILAAVVRAEPDWAALPAETPAAIRNLLQRCLRKDAKQRLQSIGDSRIALEEILSGAAAPEEARVGVPAQRSRSEFLAWALVAVLALIAAGAGTWAWLALRAPVAPAILSQLAPPSGATFAFSGNEAGSPAISPDGRKLAFAAIGADGKQRLWVRPLDAAAARPLEGTDGAAFPFWSPDGRSLGFFANGKLNCIDASGGPVLALSDARAGRGGAWNHDGAILFSPGAGDPLFQVSASGGTAQEVTKLNAARQETSHRWPQFLPDGKHFLFYAHGNVSQNNATYAASLGGGEPKLLVRGDSNAVYAPPGHLLFIRQGTLMAQRFDANSLGLTGEATPLVEHAEWNGSVHRGLFTVSEGGILAYEPGNLSSGGTHILWYDRGGKQIAETGTPAEFATPSISPDGRRLAVTMIDPSSSGTNIWVYDLARGTKTRLTFSQGINVAPVWSPDGKTIAFVSTRGGQSHLYRKPADGTGSTIRVVVDDASETNPSGSADGRYLLFRRQSTQSGSHGEVWAAPFFGDRRAFPVVQGKQFDAFMPALSPDGKWLAYMSTESGQAEIYVAPFLHGSGKWEVSTRGGLWPRWRRDGKELFYLALDNEIMSVEIAEQGASFAAGKVQPLFRANPTPGHLDWMYDVSADGKKFVVASQGGAQVAAPLTLVVNWPALLKKQ